MLEVASEHAALLTDPNNVLAPVRYALRRTIVQETFGDSNEFKVLGVHPEFERLIDQTVGNAAAAPEGAIEPSLARLFGEEVIVGINEMEGQGLAPVILTGSKSRLTLSRLARRIKSQAIVVSMSELPSTGNVTFHKVLCNRGAAG